MTAHILHLLPQTVCKDPGLPWLVAHLHTVGDIDDTTAAVYSHALVCDPARLDTARAAAVLLLTLDPDLRAHADGIRLADEFAPNGTRDLWDDLCRLSDEWRALAGDPGVIDGYLDADAPVWSRSGFRDEQLQQIAAEWARVAAWLVGGGARLSGVDASPAFQPPSAERGSR